jgi:uncharacterized membrane protein (UPF0127 family)
VFFPIYVYFLNERKEVIEEVYLKPFRIYRTKEKVRYVVESAEKLENI